MIANGLMAGALLAARAATAPVTPAEQALITGLAGRLAVGLEHVDDITDDLRECLHDLQLAFTRFPVGHGCSRSSNRFSSPARSLAGKRGMLEIM